MNGRAPVNNPFPELVLADTLWEFGSQRDFESRAEFEEAVRLYHVQAQDYAPDIIADECWRPAEMVLPSRRVVIRYFSDSDAEDLP
jgi:hypothetical protein